MLFGRDEIGKQLKCKVCGMGLFSRVLQGVLHKGKIQLLDAGVEACIYFKQITTKKVCILNFTIFKNKYLGLCICFYQRRMLTLLLATFKCPHAQFGVLWP
jgi:hypothetical protein